MPTPTLTKQISAHIRAILAAEHITMTELARRLGKKNTYVTTRLNNIVDISATDIQLFAEQLGYTPEELISEPFTLHPIAGDKNDPRQILKDGSVR